MDTNMINISRNIYNHLMDEESKYIYENRLLFSLTGDVKHIKNIVRTIEEFNWFADENELYLFGAGRWGEKYARMWPDSWKGIFDNDPAKWGGVTIENIPILNPNEILKAPFHGKIVISSKVHYKEIYNQLISFGLLDENIVNIGAILRNLVERQYFSLKELPHESNEVFADVGSYDAMTAIRFIEWSGNKFEKVYCFEADVQNIAKCEKTIESYIAEGKAQIIGKGAWSVSGNLAFISRGTTGSKISLKDEETENSIGVVALDEIFENRKVSFLKMDIEGAELEALKGSENIIRKQKPKLAISIYHKSEDILTLPEIILQYNPEYKLYLRHYSFSNAETVLYAI